MLNAIKGFDQFGSPIYLNYNGLRTFKTPVGSIFTILFISVSIYNLVTLSHKLLNLKDPNVVHNRIWQSDPERIELNENSFEFAFGLQSYPTFAHFIDESVYTIEAFLRHQTRAIDENGKEIFDVNISKLPLENCANLPTHIGQKHERIAIKQTYCVDFTKFGNLFLQGTWESPVYVALDLKFYMCSNSTSSNITCKPQEEIDKLLEGSYFDMHFSDLQLDLNDAQNPQKRFRNAYWDQLSPKLYRENYVYLKTVKVNTDEGLVQENIKRESFVAFDHSFSTFSNLEWVIGNF